MYVGIKQLLHHHLTTSDVARYAALALVVSCLALAIAYEMTSPGPNEAPAAQVLVHQGDTLWDLARTYGPHGADPRRTVSRIRELNHLTDSLIRPGEVVLVPQS